MRYLFIINAGSGTSGRPERTAATIASWLESSARSGSVRITRSLSQLDAIWESDDLAGADVVCAVGGDGTVLELGRRLSGPDRRHLAVLPMGSGNGFARHIGMPMDLRKGLEALETAHPVRIDTGVAAGHRFLGTFGVGFDAVVAHAFAAAGQRGLASYVRVGAAAFFGYSPETFRLVVDGREVVETAALLTVANSNQYGNEARITPHASLKDGLLDICILREVKLPEIPHLLRRLFEGRFHECSQVCLLSARSIVIRRERAGAAHIDGDPIETEAEIAVRVDPQSLSVMVPRARIDSV